MREYQKECIAAIKSNFKAGIAKQLVCLPTASGKTVIFANLIRITERKTLILAHTIELIEQARDTILRVYPQADIGLVSGNHKDFDHHIVIATIQSARQEETMIRLGNAGFKLCIYDECHHAGAGSSRSFLDYMGFYGDDFIAGNLLVGFTATPEREGRKQLKSIFTKIVYSKSVVALIADKYLVEPFGIQIKVKKDLDLSKMDIVGKDYKKSSLGVYMNDPELIDAAVNSWIESADNRQTVCFGVSIAHAMNLCEAFKARGIKSACITNKTPTFLRNSILEQFANGEFKILTNCLVLTEGWDCPSVQCILIARPTKIRALYQQMVGRGMRLHPGKKDCLILDFCTDNHDIDKRCILLDDDNTEIGDPSGERQSSSKSPLIISAMLKEFNLIGKLFVWEVDGKVSTIKGTTGNVIRVEPCSSAYYRVIRISPPFVTTVIAKDVEHDFAISVAEDLAKNHQNLFFWSASDAPWRNGIITPSQKAFIFDRGIDAPDGMTQGEAHKIISVIKRKEKNERHARVN